MSDQTGIKPQILTNMQTHYGSLIKAGATGLGNDEMSKSIFGKFDTNGDRTISADEINANNVNIQQVLSEVAMQFKDLASKFFGNNYTEQLKKAEETQTNPPNEQNNGNNSSEKVILQNIQDAHQKILKYAEAHPEDTRIQEYAQKLQELELSVTSKDADFVAETISGDKSITFSAKTLENLDPNTVLKNLLHEVGHYVNGDELSSIPEEIDVESFAIDTAENITGQKIVENKEEHINEFASRYESGMSSNYGKYSPGYNGIPINAGFTINNEIKEVHTNQEGNATTIISDFSGWRQEHHVSFGEEKDADGNPYPISAKETIFPEDGQQLTSVYSNYDKDRKVWLNKSDYKTEEEMLRFSTPKLKLEEVTLEELPQIDLKNLKSN